MKYVFPAILEPEGKMYNVSFPDIPSCYTCGEDLTDALYMAEDVLNGWLSRAEEKGEMIPEASAPCAVLVPAGCTMSLILADTEKYRRMTSNRAVRKNVSMPAWMADLADQRGINCSQVLQEALRERLGVQT